jgi:hypothetical protein
MCHPQTVFTVLSYYQQYYLCISKREEGPKLTLEEPPTLYPDKVVGHDKNSNKMLWEVKYETVRPSTLFNKSWGKGDFLRTVNFLMLSLF